MTAAHSSHEALQRSARGIAVFGAAMIAGDAAARSSLRSHEARADEALEGRRADHHDAQSELGSARGALSAARTRVQAAQVEVSRAHAAVDPDPRYSGPGLARLRAAEGSLSAARSDESRAEQQVVRARRALAEAEEAMRRCRAAGERIHAASERYRRSALSYVGISGALILRGRAQLGRLSGLLDEYHAIGAYGSAPGASAASSGGPGAGAAAGGSGSYAAIAGWESRWGLTTVPLRDIDTVGSDECSARDRWDVERFENALPPLLAGEDWERRIDAADAASGRSGERTLREVVRRLLENPVTVLPGSPLHVVAGRGHVAAAQRAGLTELPVRRLAGDAADGVGVRVDGSVR